MSDSKLDEAFSAIRSWYYTEVRSIADNAIEACVGKVRPSRKDEREVWSDALKEGRESDAANILAHAAKHGDVERVGRERDAHADARDFLVEHIDEVTDSHQFVTYTFQSKCLLLASDNEGAYESEIGEAPSGPQAIAAQACMAMRADVWELLEARSEEWEDRDCEDCCTTLGVEVVDSVSDEHAEECSLHPANAAKDGLMFVESGTFVKISVAPNGNASEHRRLLDDGKIATLVEDARIGNGAGWDVYDLRFEDGRETFAHGFELSLPANAAKG